jgi:hypothetical protein
MPHKGKASPCSRSGMRRSRCTLTLDILNSLGTLRLGKRQWPALLDVISGPQ